MAKAARQSSELLFNVTGKPLKNAWNKLARLRTVARDLHRIGDYKRRDLACARHDDLYLELLRCDKTDADR